MQLDKASGKMSHTKFHVVDLAGAERPETTGKGRATQADMYEYFYFGNKKLDADKLTSLQVIPHTAVACHGPLMDSLGLAVLCCPGDDYQLRVVRRYALNQLQCMRL